MTNFHDSRARSSSYHQSYKIKQTPSRAQAPEDAYSKQPTSRPESCRDLAPTSTTTMTTITIKEPGPLMPETRMATSASEPASNIF